MAWLILFLFVVGFSLRYNWWRIPKSYSLPRVLMYHSISEHMGEKHDKWRVRPQDFEKQMKWFSQNGWQSFTISELCALEKVPHKAFVVTFDDGYGDNFTNAFPILQKYNFKATIYLVPNKILNSWEKENTKTLSYMLSTEQIVTMAKSGLIEFGSHTLSHVNLENIDSSILKQELECSKKQVEKIISNECKAFAYPYGKYNDKIIKAVKDIGYLNATIVKRGLFEMNANVYKIKRLGILGTESFFDFYLKITRVRNKL